MPAGATTEVRCALFLSDSSSTLDPLQRFASTLPYKVRYANRLHDGLAWAPRPVALLHDEIAPDPPGWTTSLRFDIDCVCEGRPHIRRGYCSHAAGYWRVARVAEPSFVVVNPANGHAHYVYLLRGWVRSDGADAGDMAAVRYLGAITRAYTLALRADPGYAGLVHHNPLSARYTTIAGECEPYTLHALASHVALAASPRRRAAEIRCDGRNIETFDRLRSWAYRAIAEWRCGAYRDWADVVAERALAIATAVRDGYPTVSHPFSDKEALGVAKSVAGWVWLRYDAANPIVAAARAALRRARDRARAMVARRARGAVTREEFLAAAQRRREAALRLQSLGVSVAEIAHRLRAGLRSVYRWLSGIRSLPRPSALSDFKAEKLGNVKVFEENISTVGVPDVVSKVDGAHGESAGSPLGCRLEYAPPARSAEPWRSPCDAVRMSFRRRRP